MNKKVLQWKSSPANVIEEEGNTMEIAKHENKDCKLPNKYITCGIEEEGNTMEIAKHENKDCKLPNKYITCGIQETRVSSGTLTLVSPWPVHRSGLGRYR